MLKKTFFAGLFTLLSIGLAQAEIIKFDTLGSLLDSNGYYFDESNPTGFQVDGFQFDMALMSQSAYKVGYSNTNDFPSPDIAVYSNDATETNNPFDNVTVSRINNAQFNFLGAHFGGFTYNDTTAWYAATELTIEGFSAGNLVDSATFSPLNVGFLRNDIGFYGVDELVFTATQGTYDYASYGLTNSGDGSYWMMDNFEYSPVPEPSTFLLLGSGLAGLGFYARKRKKA